MLDASLPLETRLIRQTLRADLMMYVLETPEDDDAFDALSMRVAEFQANNIAAYGRLVAARSASGDNWRQMPLVPVELFRDLDLCWVPEGAEVAATFQTSGTTGAGQRGTRRVPDLWLYHAEMRAPFVAAVLDGDEAPRPWLALVPTAEMAPRSSLTHMVDGLARTFATPSETIWAMNDDGLDIAAALAWLTARAENGTPGVILATSFALVALLDALDAADATIALPPGSRMMLTGGFKGKSRTLDERDLLAWTERRLGLPAAAIVPEYGMTELTSQAYGRPLMAPPWLKIRIVDPLTHKDVPSGTMGHVAFFDLLSLDNISALVTSDLGVLDADGALTLHGRAPGAALRGCSLTAEELIG